MFMLEFTLFHHHVLPRRFCQTAILPREESYRSDNLHTCLVPCVPILYTLQSSKLSTMKVEYKIEICPYYIRCRENRRVVWKR